MIGIAYRSVIRVNTPFETNRPGTLPSAHLSVGQTQMQTIMCIHPSNRFAPLIVCLTFTLAGCNSDSSQPTVDHTDTGGASIDAPPTENFCAQFTDQTTPYFCEDFTATSPTELAGAIAPMSFRDQSFRTYTRGEIFNLPDPDRSSHNDNVLNLHTDLVDGIDFSRYARATAAVAANWDITAHSRDGYIAPGTGAGFNDHYWWNESAFMGEHGARCSPPPDLDATRNTSRNGERAYTFMERFFTLPVDYSGDELTLANHWNSANENILHDDAGVHAIVRYEDMVYVCADHLMTAAYAAGASKLTLTPNHLVDTRSGDGIVEFAVSTYRTAGRDYWQLDLSPLDSHLQLPEGDVVADANGKALNSLSINTVLNDAMTGPADAPGAINVFRSMMIDNGRFLQNGQYIQPDDANATWVRAQIANPGDPDRQTLYQNAPDSHWVITHTSYNQVMLDHLRANAGEQATLHSVTDNRSRAQFRLTIKKTPESAAWAANPELWDQVSLCMPQYGDGCIGEYIVPELPALLLVQFTHYAYNTTKSCASGGEQPHSSIEPGTIYQTTCHPNTYHWDNFYIALGVPLRMIRADARTDAANGDEGELITLEFPEAAPEKSKLRFTALAGAIGDGPDTTTSIEMSFDQGASWHRPRRQPEPQNNFDRFRSYYTGTSQSEYIPSGTTRVWLRAQNAPYRNRWWIRDASIWSVE